MKKLLLFVVLSGYALFGSAQNQDSTVVHRKNVLKFLPVNLPFQSTSFEFERMINDKNSVTLGVGLPNQKSLVGKYGIDASSDLKTAELGTMHIRAAFRHYKGKRKLPNGFYIEPYLKYQNIKGTATVTGMTDQNEPFAGSLDVNLNTMNLGFQSGVQFLIAKRIAFDIYFLGFEAGFLSGKVIAVSDEIAKADNLKADIDKAIADLPSFIGKKLTVTQSSDKKQIDVKASSLPYPWLRGGISIGIAF